MIRLSIIILIACTCSGEQPLFKPGRVYQYKYIAKQHMSIPHLDSQHSGMGLEAYLKIQAEPNQLYVQLQQPQYCESSNKQTVSRSWRDVNITCQPVTGEPAQQLQKPFLLRVERCQVQSITFSKHTPTHVRNIKKAIAQLLQVDICGEQQYYSSNTPLAYTKQEYTIKGECQSQYQIPPPLNALAKAELINKIKRESPESQWKQDPYSHQVRLLHKIRNSHQCRKKPVVRHIMPPALECYSEDCYQIAANGSTITTYVIDGDFSDASVRKIQLEETKAIYSNDPMSPLITFSEQVVYLIKYERSSAKFPAIPDPEEHHNLTYQYPTISNQIPPDSDFTSAPAIPPYMPGAYIAIPQNQAVRKFVELLRSVKQQISEPNPTEPHPYPTSAIIECQRAMSLLSYNSIASIPRQLQNPTEKYLFYNIVPTVGTKPAIKYVIDTVRASSVPPSLRNLMLSIFPMHIKEKSVATMNALLDLLRSEPVASHPQSRYTLSMAIGTVLNAWCVNNNTRHSHYPEWAETFCQSDAIKQATASFIHQMQTYIASGSYSDKQAYCQALGNLGSKEVIKPLRKVIYGERDPLTVSKAIYALERASAQHPYQARNILLNAYLDYNKPTKARLAAAISLISSDPPLHIMKMIASKTWTEPSAQVRTLIYRMYKSLAQTTNPRFGKLRSIGQKAALCISLMKPTIDATMFSTKYYLSQMMDQLYSRLHTFCGLFHRHTYAPINIYQHSTVYKNDRIDEVIKSSLDLDGVKFYKIIEYLFARAHAPTNHQLPQDLAKIMDVLRKHNALVEALPTTVSLFVQLNSLSRYWSYNITASNFSFPQGQPWTKEVSTQAIFFTEEKIEAVPSEIGTPMYVIQSNPTVLSVAGQIQVTNKSNDGYFSVKYNNRHFYFETRPRLMMSTISPFSKNELGVGTDAPLRVKIPSGELAASLNLQTRSVDVRAALKESSPQHIFWYERIPYTKAAPYDQFDYKVPSTTVKPIEPQPKPYTKIPLISEEYLKTELTLKSYPRRLNSQLDWYKEHAWSYVGSRPYKYEERANMVLTVYPSQSKSTVMEAVFAPTSLNHSVPQPPPADKRVVQPTTYTQLIAEVQELRERLRQMPTAANFTTAVAAAFAAYQTPSSGQPTHSVRVHAISAYMPQNHTQLVAVGVHKHEPISARVWLHVPQTSESRAVLLSTPTRMPIHGEMQLSQTHVTVQAALETDPRGIAYAQSSPHAQRCQRHEADGHPFSWDCERAKDQAAYPTRLNAIFRATQLEPKHKETLKRVSEYLKYAIYPYMPEWQYQPGPANQVNLTLLVNQSRSTYEVFYRQPSETVRIHSMRLPRVFKKVTMRTPPVQQFMNGMFGSVVCACNDKYLQTLDNKSVPLPDTKPSHLLLNFYMQSPRDYMAVLKRNASVVVLVGSDQVQVKLAPGQPSSAPQYDYSANGAPSHRLGTIPLFVKNLQSCRYSGIYVYQKADTAYIYIPRYGSLVAINPRFVKLYKTPESSMRRNMGACGNYDREKRYELVDAKGCVVNDYAKFINSYYVRLPGDTYQPPPRNGPCHQPPIDFY